MKQTHDCPYCGDPVYACGKGRPPIWCSDTCRTNAYRDRRAARRGMIALEVHEVVRDREVEVVHEVVRERVVEPTWDDLVAKVLSSPKATARVVHGVAERVRDGRIDAPGWRAVQDSINDLGDALYEP